MIVRTRHPESRIDRIADDPMIRRTLGEKHRNTGGTVLLNAARLQAEGEDLIQLCRDSEGNQPE